MNNYRSPRRSHDSGSFGYKSLLGGYYYPESSYAKKAKVKVINIGPDPPGLYRRYIWGRDSEYNITLRKVKFTQLAKLHFNILVGLHIIP